MAISGYLYREEVRKVTEIEFLQKEEERFRGCLEMHENCAKNLREEIGVIQKIRKMLQRQPGDMDCPID